MLVDDVADNKSIGLHGAEFLKQQLGNSKHTSVLTHCNTGSLATAGYGTALGVVRALHSGGILEKAFCTETRPFNQGSRLTAFELVHDKIPATLISDSAAAALMKNGSVQAVIVGADRIAANGDTANKIGTYNLAISAKHHGVQFYVAVPVTLIDLSLPSGHQIGIEEKSPKELLNSEGGLGKQVAASTISVWNPAFDVTPTNLITALMTEKYVGGNVEMAYIKREYVSIEELRVILDDVVELDERDNIEYFWLFPRNYMSHGLRELYNEESYEDGAEYVRKTNEDSDYTEDMSEEKSSGDNMSDNELHVISSDEDEEATKFRANART
ncbi:hypothetical protein ABZP36_008804 [Zizania latifolia]